MPSFFRRPSALAALGLAALLPLAACDSGDGSGDGATADVTVMTRNLYLGADLFVLLQAQTPQQVPALAGQLYTQVLASDFTARAAEIAAEIDAADPDLVGLQEVSQYRTDRPSNYAAGAAPNAATVEVDFLAILQQALTARGLSYTVVATNTNADVELPATTNGTAFFDVRLTDRDVVLAREGVSVSDVETGLYQVAAPVPIGGSNVSFLRGYSTLTAEVDDVAFTFVNTHLEVGGSAVVAQIAQASELNAILDEFDGPVILTGDLNSDPADAGQGGNSYRLLTTGTTPLRDAWTSTGGFTCCEAPDLRNTTSEHTERIDLVLYRGDVTVLGVDVVGEEPGDRTAGGLWPSDHAGVVATLRVRGDASAALAAR